jgi:anti-sigma B factor antagonist
MAYDIRINGDIAMLVLSGDVDLQTTSDMKTDIIDITGITQLDIDAADVTYIDSSGVAVLLLARQHCLQNNILINFKSASSALYRVLQMAKLETILPITKIVDAAEDNGALGLGGGGVFSAPPAGDGSLPKEIEDDDPLVQALLDEADASVIDETNDQQPLHESTAEKADTETSDHSASPFGEAVSDEALTSALLADVEEHEDSMAAEARSADKSLADKSDADEESDDTVISALKPGNFNWE